MLINSSKVRDLLTLLASFILIRFAFIYFQPSSAISFDVQSFGYWLDVYHKGQNPYISGARLNYPPVWLQILILLSKTATFLDLSFTSVLQCFLILAEALTLVLVYLLVWKVTQKSPFTAVLYGIVLNPISIFQVCQHLQFDILVSLSLLGSLLFLIKWHSDGNSIDWLIACALVGIGIVTKVAPIFFVPLLCVRIRNLGWKERTLGVLLVFAPLVFGLSILASVGHQGNFVRSLEYRSAPGYFGFSGLFSMLGFDTLLPWYQLAFNLICVIQFVGFASYFSLRKSISLSELVLLPFFLFLSVITLAPGYGPQYIMWILPLAVVSYSILRDSSWRVFLIAAYAVTAITYCIEYALLPSHGEFLTKLTASPVLELVGQTLSSSTAQTLLRLPLFLVYLAVSACGFWSLKSNHRTPVT